jgi:hypothetical protein
VLGLTRRREQLFLIRFPVGDDEQSPLLALELMQPIVANRSAAERLSYVG